MRPRAAFLALVTLLGGTAFGIAADWKTYRNARFGASADIPVSWKSQPPPANGDGLAFRSPDGKARITVSGIFSGVFVRDEKLDEDVEMRARPDTGETITFKAIGKASVVVSGTRGDTIFYRRSMTSCGDKIWNDLVIEYPAAQKAVYDAIVSHVSASLRGGRNIEVENCR